MSYSSVLMLIAAGAAVLLTPSKCAANRLVASAALLLATGNESVGTFAPGQNLSPSGWQNLSSSGWQNLSSSARQNLSPSARQNLSPSGWQNLSSSGSDTLFSSGWFSIQRQQFKRISIKQCTRVVCYTSLANLLVRAKAWLGDEPVGICRGFRLYQKPGPASINSASARLFKMGTLEETKDQAWTWVLGCPMDQVREAGVAFDPNARGVKSVQGDASSGSALEVSLSFFFALETSSSNSWHAHPSCSFFCFCLSNSHPVHRKNPSHCHES